MDDVRYALACRNETNQALKIQSNLEAQGKVGFVTTS